jgi:hypothetical protein
MTHTSELGEGGRRGAARRNALPLIAIGAGAYWLYRANRRRGTRAADYHRYAEYSEFDFGPGPLDAEREEGGRLRGLARGVADRTQAGVGRLKRRARSGLERGVQSRPLLMAGIAVAAGFVVGMFLPESGPERRLMGGTRDRLMGKAQEAAREATSRVREAVGLKQ